MFSNPIDPAFVLGSSIGIIKRVEAKTKKGDLVNLKRSLVEPRLCLACHMELVPYLNEDGVIVRTGSGYCDEVCKKIYRQYYRWFYAGRIPRKIVVPKDKSLPSIDLRL